MKTVLNEVEFVFVDDEKSRCARCQKILSNLLLVPHSMIHKSEIRPKTSPLGYEKIREKVVTQENIIEPDLILEVSNKITIFNHPTDSPLKKIRKLNESSVFFSIQYTNRVIRYLNKFNYIYNRCAYVQQKKYYRKWNRFLLSN